ncbi:uncharacterized protein EI90DRAFT_3289104 [Cantharellus anzutake]|uniref:uncharacterized protein n=1 Tax=Cantharellus anzutake TaxID=1750568 RepID=UPI001906066F|nr:uncharacterized protein EI90DRAFT_3289104 [Cantharellus anzutake]KAF8332410.1 hypothetical protein EI90DRAFT_3289104 [Cantharellus anzutake]
MIVGSSGRSWLDGEDVGHQTMLLKVLSEENKELRENNRDSPGQNAFACRTLSYANEAAVPYSNQQRSRVHIRLHVGLPWAVRAGGAPELKYVMLDRRIRQERWKRHSRAMCFLSAVRSRPLWLRFQIRVRVNVHFEQHQLKSRSSKSHPGHQTPWRIQYGPLRLLPSFSSVISVATRPSTSSYDTLPSCNKKATRSNATGPKANDNLGTAGVGPPEVLNVRSNNASMGPSILNARLPAPARQIDAPPQTADNGGSQTLPRPSPAMDDRLDRVEQALAGLIDASHREMQDKIDIVHFTGLKGGLDAYEASINELRTDIKRPRSESADSRLLTNVPYPGTLPPVPLWHSERSKTVRTTVLRFTLETQLLQALLRDNSQKRSAFRLSLGLSNVRPLPLPLVPRGQKQFLRPLPCGVMRLPAQAGCQLTEHPRTLTVSRLNCPVVLTTVPGQQASYGRLGMTQETRLTSVPSQIGGSLPLQTASSRKRSALP